MAIVSVLLQGRQSPGSLRLGGHQGRLQDALRRVGQLLGLQCAVEHVPTAWPQPRHQLWLQAGTSLRLVQLLAHSALQEHPRLVAGRQSLLRRDQPSRSKLGQSAVWVVGRPTATRVVVDRGVRVRAVGQELNLPDVAADVELLGLG